MKPNCKGCAYEHEASTGECAQGLNKGFVDCHTPTATIRDYMASLGRKGGKTTGERKRRGDSEYYRRIAAMRKHNASK